MSIHNQHKFLDIGRALGVSTASAHSIEHESEALSQPGAVADAANFTWTNQWVRLSVSLKEGDQPHGTQRTVARIGPAGNPALTVMSVLIHP